MNKQTRNKYAEYIATVAQQALTDSGIRGYPDETILCVSVHSELAELENIIGWPIYVIDMPSSYDMTIAIPSGSDEHDRLVTAFREALESA